MVLQTDLVLNMSTKTTNPDTCGASDEEAFSVSSHDHEEKILAEIANYKKEREQFLEKYGDPTSPGYHRKRAAEDILKPEDASKREVTSRNDSNDTHKVTLHNVSKKKPKVTLDYEDKLKEVFQTGVMTTLNYHGDLLNKIESRMFLLEEKFHNMEQVLEMVTMESRRTRRLLEYRLDRQGKLSAKDSVEQHEKDESTGH